MSILRLPDGAIYREDAGRPARRIPPETAVAKAARAARADRTERAREFRRIAERTSDPEVYDFYTKQAEELESR